MCKEINRVFSLGSVVLLSVLLQLNDTNAQSVGQCGRRKTSRIVGGYDTRVNEYPMMAGLVHNRYVMCGGIVVSDWYIATAAHCFSGKNVKDIAILVGEHDVSTGSDTPYAFVYQSNNVIIHSGYTGKDLNDIAVLKSASQIQFNVAVGPVCLPFGQDQFVDRYVEAVGWGTKWFGGPRANVLQKVTLKVISNAQCAQTYGNRIQPSLICTYMANRDACQNDSGGPLFLIEGGLVYLVGIIAFGTGCGGNSTGVHTRVTSHADWIRANILK